MPATAGEGQKTLTRKQLAERLNEDLAREYQAIIAYVVYSQAIKGASFMGIAKDLEEEPAKPEAPPADPQKT